MSKENHLTRCWAIYTHVYQTILKSHDVRELLMAWIHPAKMRGKQICVKIFFFYNTTTAPNLVYNPVCRVNVIIYCIFQRHAHLFKTHFGIPCMLNTKKLVYSGFIFLLFESIPTGSFLHIINEKVFIERRFSRSLFEKGSSLSASLLWDEPEFAKTIYYLLSCPVHVFKQTPYGNAGK